MGMGSRMQHGSAQPTAAHALQGKRNARVVGCDEDNAQPAAAYALQRYEILLQLLLTGASQTTQRQSNESLGHSDGMKAMRSPQRRAHCRATKFLVMCDEGNAEPAAAYAPHNHEIHCSVSTP